MIAAIEETALAQREAAAPDARATVGQILAGFGGYLGSRLMSGGDFVTPFYVMAALYAAGTVVFWIWFRPMERATAAGVAPHDALVPEA